MSKANPSNSRKQKVIIWKVSTDFVLNHPHYNPDRLSFQSAHAYVYAHTRQIDWSAMHRARSTPGG